MTTILCQCLDAFGQKRIDADTVDCLFCRPLPGQQIRFQRNLMLTRRIHPDVTASVKVSTLVEWPCGTYSCDGGTFQKNSNRDMRIAFAQIEVDRRRQWLRMMAEQAG